MSYTPFNKIKTITENISDTINGVEVNNTITTNLTYDSFNTLLSKTVGNKTTLYVTPEYEYVITKHNESNHTIEMNHNLYDDNNKLVAVHTKTISNASLPENQTIEFIDGDKMVDKTQYFHKDALDTIDTVTNQEGNVTLRQRYTPFGAIHQTQNYKKDIYPYLNLRGYTSHRHHYEHKLINMNGRTYDPTISRFTSPDPHVTLPTNGQNYNRYAYVINNPLKYVDPTGYDVGFGGSDVGETGGYGSEEGYGGSDGDGDYSTEEAANDHFEIESNTQDTKNKFVQNTDVPLEEAKSVVEVISSVLNQLGEFAKNLGGFLGKAFDE